MKRELTHLCLAFSLSTFAAPQWPLWFLSSLLYVVALLMYRAARYPPSFHPFSHLRILELYPTWMNGQSKAKYWSRLLFCCCMWSWMSSEDQKKYLDGILKIDLYRSMFPLVQPLNRRPMAESSLVVNRQVRRNDLWSLEILYLFRKLWFCN